MKSVKDNDLQTITEISHLPLFEQSSQEQRTTRLHTMTDTEEDVLTNRIRELEKELDSLRLQQNARRDQSGEEKASSFRLPLPLALEEYVRYGRQMILPQIGLSGQLALKKSSVLVIGAGGLGCPVLLYLVAAGIGIQCIHFDSSNLQERWV